MGETTIVIGASHVGTATINTILGQLPRNRVITSDGNPNISFLGCGMTLWIGKQISGPEGLSHSSRKVFEGKGAMAHMGTEISRINYDKKMIHGRGRDGAIHEQPYDKLILATGSPPIRPELQGVGLGNVQFVKLYQNARNVIQKLKGPSVRRIAVVGAGYIGVKLVEVFTRNGREVVLIDCAGICLARYYDGEFSYTMRKNLGNHGAELVLGETVVKLEGRKRVQTVVIDQARYQANMVIFDIGSKPNTGLGQRRLKLLKNGAYLADRRQGTSVAGVYAIGDRAAAYNNAIQATDYIALATSAVRSDVVAVHNAYGRMLEPVGVQGSSGVSIWGLRILCTDISLRRAQRTGYAAASSDYEGWQRAEFMENGNSKVKIHIVHDEETGIILGTQMCSDYDIFMGIHLSSMIIEEQVTVDRLKLFDLLFPPHSNKPCSYTTMAALAAR